MIQKFIRRFFIPIQQQERLTQLNQESTKQLKETISQLSSKQAQLRLLEDERIRLTDIESRVFTQRGADIYIGTNKLTDQERDILRGQAKYLQTSQLWEILNATIVNEAADISLRQSQNFEHVQNGKMLYHWGHVFKNLITTLAK